MKRQNHFYPVLLALAVGMPLPAAHAQPAAPAQTAPDYSSTSGVIPWTAIMEKPLAGAAGAGSASAAATGATDAVKGDGKPIHEELSRENLKESIREFNAGEAGAKKPGTEEPADGTNPVRNPLSTAAKAAKEQANRADWAKVNQRDGALDDVLPWAFAVAALLLMGLAIKVWLSYLKAKAARPGMRRRAARKRSHRSSRSAALASDAPNSQGDASTSNGAGGAAGQGGAGGERSSRSSSRSSSAPDDSSRRRHRSPRSQP